MADRNEVVPLYKGTSAGETPSCEILTLPALLTSTDLEALANAKSIEGRIGTRLDFELDATVKAHLSAFTKAMNKQK